LAIFVLIMWLGTATAGLTLLRAGAAARRLAAGTGTGRAESATITPVRSGALPLTADGRPPPTPRARVTTPAGEHPLLEFSHPALAIAGIACWSMFVFVHYRPFAWVALGVLLLTLGMGVSWLTSNRRAARHEAAAAWAFPRRLIVLHGVVASCSIILTVLATLSASHT
jgi:hypothetical protein